MLFLSNSDKDGRKPCPTSYRPEDEAPVAFEPETTASVLVTAWACSNLPVRL
jgi:hypothetical protein